MPAEPHRPIRVVIADGHPLFLDGLARTIRQDSALQLVAEHGDGRAALDSIRSVHPDVAVLALDMPGLDGRRVLDALVRDDLTTGVLLLITDVRADAFAAVAAGARGCLSKRVSAERLRQAVRRVAAGEAALCEELQTVVVREVGLRYRDERCLLSGREREVLSLVAQGLSTPEIARRLYLGASTVKSHLANIYERLGARERAQAVAEAMRRGLLD